MSVVQSNFGGHSNIGMVVDEKDRVGPTVWNSGTRLP